MYGVRVSAAVRMSASNDNCHTHLKALAKMCLSLRNILDEPCHTKIYTVTFIIVMLKVSYVIWSFGQPYCNDNHEFLQEWFRPSVICLTKCTFLVRHIKLTYVPGYVRYSNIT